MATALIGRGVGQSDIILTFADNSIEHTIVLFAAILLGIPIQAISTTSNVYEMENLFKTLDSFVLITSQSKAEIIDKVVVNSNETKVKTFVVLDGISDNCLTYESLLKEGNNRRLERIPHFNVNPKSDTCLLLQSSGTSGVPKSVILSHRAFMATILDFKEFPIVENPLYAHMTPFGCISGLTVLFTHIPHGIPVVIYKQMSEDSILESIDKYRVNYMYITPPFGHTLVDDRVVNKYDLSSLKQIFTGGSPFAPTVGRALVQRYNVKLNESEILFMFFAIISVQLVMNSIVFCLLIIVYGMTEYFPISDCGKDSQYFPGNTGKVTPNTELKIIDINTGLSLGPNFDGEICVRGEKMFSGYLNNDLATNETIDKEGWLHTGDIGHLNESHCLFITDRLKELIKYQTKAVSPTEIEQFLLTHPCVAEVAVVGVTHIRDNQWPRAYVKVKPGMTVSEEELMKYVSGMISKVLFEDRIH